MPLWPFAAAFSALALIAAVVALAAPPHKLAEHSSSSDPVIVLQK